MEIGVDDIAVGGIDALDRANRDVFSDHDLEILDISGVSRDRVGAIGQHRRGELRREAGDGVGLGREVGLGLDLHDGSGVAVDCEGDGAFVVVAAAALTGLGQTSLAQQLRGGFEITVGFRERPLRVHHPRAGGIAQRFDVLSRNRHIGVLRCCSVVVVK